MTNLVEVWTINKSSEFVPECRTHLEAFEWNYGRLKNRNLTDPEFQKLLDYEALVSDILSTVQSKAVPAFTAEELAKFDPTDITLLQKLISSTKEQSDELQSIFSTHGIAPFQRYDDVFSLIDLPLATWEALIDLQSGTPDAQQQEAILSAFSSRAQPLLDNVEPTDAFTNKFITVTAGAVLTFNATAFANTAVIL